MEKPGKKVVLVFLHYHLNNFLLQLRDFKPDIVYPGCWGGFGGEIETGETPAQAGFREIREELGYRAFEMNYFQHYDNFDNLNIYVFYSQMNKPPEELCLTEGQEIGMFNAENILSGSLVSKKYQKAFPVATPLPSIFRDFLEYIGKGSGMK